MHSPKVWRRAALLEFEVFRRELAEQRARAHVGLAEPGAFLAAKTDDAQRRGRGPAAAPLPDEAQQPGHHAREAVVIAALRHRV
jgi:hypothetical protein